MYMGEGCCMNTPWHGWKAKHKLKFKSPLKG